MLHEFKKVSQEKKGFRRLFSDEMFDLFIWYNKMGGSIIGFQIVYMFGKSKKAFTWESEKGYMHSNIDGWDGSGYKITPLLVRDGVFDKNEMLKILETELCEIEKPIRDLVLDKIRQYPNLR
jgi:hypothetical protein